MKIFSLLAGLLLSGTAAFYSIVGLLAIFPGAVLPIVLMGGSLEFAKLVAASWLYRNWNIAPRLIRIYFIFAICVLMFITSLGIFGYLSKVHLESSVSVADNSLQIARIEQQIAAQQRQIDNAQKSLYSLDAVIEKSFLDGARIRNSQKAERALLNSTISESDSKIAELNLSLIPLRRSNIESEAKVGPLKYIAELIYGEEKAIEYFDKAVRFVIILIVLVFDPLAVLLLIATNITPQNNHQSNKQKQVSQRKNKTVDLKSTRKYNSRKSINEKPGSIYNFMMGDDFGIQHTNEVSNSNESTRKTKEE